MAQKRGKIYAKAVIDVFRGEEFWMLFSLGQQMNCLWEDFTWRTEWVRGNHILFHSSLPQSLDYDMMENTLEKREQKLFTAEVRIAIMI